MGIKFGIAAGIVIIFILYFWLKYVRMPGSSFKGTVKPLEPEKSDMMLLLKKHTVKLSVDIGERNFTTPDKYKEAGDYIYPDFQRNGITASGTVLCS